MENVTGRISGEAALNGSLSGQNRLAAGGLSLQNRPYTGSYEFTPSQETQTVAILGKIATQDITINPIPNNYGLVTWNGAYLRIS